MFDKGREMRRKAKEEDAVTLPPIEDGKPLVQSVIPKTSGQVCLVCLVCTYLVCTLPWD